MLSACAKGGVIKMKGWGVDKQRFASEIKWVELNSEPEIQCCHVNISGTSTAIFCTCSVF